MSNETNPIVVMMTASNAEEATRIADVLVERRLAACVQILPQITSIYVWQGEVQREAEVFILAKSVQVKFAELERAVRAIHSYETPEIIALPIAEISEPYLSWLSKCLEGS